MRESKSTDELGWINVPGRFAPDEQGLLFGTTIEVTVPAAIENLALLGEAAREYCAALPLIFNQLEIKRPSHEFRTKRFGTGTLVIPGSNGHTIESSYSHFVYSVQLVLQEASTNVVRHGYNGGWKPGNLLHLSLSAAEVRDENGKARQALVMVLRDDAAAFDPTSAPVRQPNPLEPQEGGYGLYLIQKLTDKLEYYHHQGHNYLKMTKFIGL